MSEINLGTTNPKAPQISGMLQKFAVAFKAKTFEFFADENEPDDTDEFTLLDSAEEVITGQRVVVIKPDHSRIEPQQPQLIDTQVREFRQTNDFSLQNSQSVVESKETISSFDRHLRKLELNHSKGKTLSETQVRVMNKEITKNLISSIFAIVSSFEASYLQLQTAHVPFNEDSIKVADKSLVSFLQRLSDIKRFYVELHKQPEVVADLSIGSCLEAKVVENQSKLRILGTVSDRLQAEIDQKDNEVRSLRKKLGEVHKSNLQLSKRLSDRLSTCCDVLLSVGVFDSVLRDTCRATHRFTKVLMSLMKKAGWNLDMAADSVYSDVEYAKKGHSHYALLSYVCLGMFRGFDSISFSLADNGVAHNANGYVSSFGQSASSMKQLLEHISSNPMEVLSMYQECAFAKFCEEKYQELIHPSIESSIFSNFNENEAVLNSWRSLSAFYEYFVEMASCIWTLHWLAFSFDPVVEIFQVERGVEYSVVYMEDVTKKRAIPCKVRPRVAFTVVPGFKIGETMVQSKVYLSGFKCER